MREALKPGCPPFEQITALYDGRLTGAESQPLRAHLSACAVCRAEWDMLSEFSSAEASVSEKAAVEEIVRTLAKARKPAGSEAGWRKWFSLPMMPRLTGAMAVLALAVALGIRWQTPRRGDLGTFEPSGEVRSGLSIQVSPRGDLQVVPAEFTWNPVPKASAYEIVVQEVDGTVLWRGRSVVSRLAMPESLRSAVLPLKTLVLQVTAFDSEGAQVAQSEAVRFRLNPANVP